jgi:predicted MFS family arabinose efflux permease
MAAAVLVFALAEHLLLVILALFAVGALRGVYYPLRTTWANQRINPQVRATVLSTVSQTDAFGQIAGGPVFGVVGAVFSLRAALALGAAVLVPSALLHSRSMRQDAAAHDAQTYPEAT